MTSHHETAAVSRARSGFRWAGILTVRTMTDRIVRTVQSATDKQLQDGTRWYRRFAMVAADLADRHGVTIEQAAAVLAIVSPRISVSGSVTMADRILANVAAGRDPRHGVPGLSERVDAAGRWLEGDTGPLDLDTDGLSSSRKVRSFFRNIMGDTDAVTVDVWAARVAGATVEQPSGGGYVAVAHAYRLAAARLDMTPRQVQAVAWCVVRSDIDAGAELEAIRQAVA